MKSDVRKLTRAKTPRPHGQVFPYVNRIYQIVSYEVRTTVSNSRAAVKQWL